MHHEKQAKQTAAAKGSGTASILPMEPNGTSFVIEEIGETSDDEGTMDTIGRLHWRNRRYSGIKTILNRQNGSRNTSVIDKETRYLETKPELWLD